MTGPSGRTLHGQLSHRCLDNTGPRRWLVIEFDTGPLDEQAALHWHLRASAVAAGWPRLALCVFSGRKSLHGWYGPCAEEGCSRELMACAIHLGADPATWNRCQLVRLPGALRPAKPASAHAGKASTGKAGTTPTAQPDTGEAVTVSIAQPTTGNPSVHRPARLTLPTRQEVFFYDPAIQPTPPAPPSVHTSSPKPHHTRTV